MVNSSTEPAIWELDLTGVNAFVRLDEDDRPELVNEGMVSVVVWSGGAHPEEAAAGAERMAAAALEFARMVRARAR